MADSGPSETTIIVVKRGTCTFVAKAMFAQIVSAKMVIIIDNKEGENVDAILPGDDGLGYQINIPVVLIRKTDGDNMLKIL